MDHHCSMDTDTCSICQQAQQELEDLLSIMNKSNFCFSFKPITSFQLLATVLEEDVVSSGVKLGSVVSETATVGATDESETD